MHTLEVVQLPGRPPGWDRDIQSYATKTLFHESAWLDFVRTIHSRGQVEYFEILQAGVTVGLFCAVRVRKAMSILMYGSPLTGSGMYMGPLVGDGVAQHDLVRAIVKVCRANGIGSLQMVNDWLEPEVMRRFGFKHTPAVTHVCPLGPDEAASWAGLRGNCRTRLRKAEKSGLEAEITGDIDVADDFYRFMTLVLQAKGLWPQYGVERPRALMQYLLPADRLFAVRVRHRGKVIGAAFYPHDDKSMYYWDGASDPAHLELCPNELLHWTAMKEAIRRGIPAFNIGGAPQPSRFTRKFGGAEVPYHSYRKDFIPFLATARNLYHWLDFLRAGRPPVMDQGSAPPPRAPLPHAPLPQDPLPQALLPHAHRPQAPLRHVPQSPPEVPLPQAARSSHARPEGASHASVPTSGSRLRLRLARAPHLGQHHGAAPREAPRGLREERQRNPQPPR